MTLRRHLRAIHRDLLYYVEPGEARSRQNIWREGYSRGLVVGTLVEAHPTVKFSASTTSISCGPAWRRIHFTFSCAPEYIHLVISA